MPALIECLLDELGSGSDIAVMSEELLSKYDLDACAISAVEGSWEQMFTGDDLSKPQVDGLISDDFKESGPSVYEVNGYLIVRGRDEMHPVFFVFERTT